jgi:hypothetical protein
MTSEEGHYSPGRRGRATVGSNGMKSSSTGSGHVDDEPLDGETFDTVN